MDFTKASTSKPSKRPRINIIPPKQLFIDLTHEDTKTPSPNYQILSPSAPNAPSKTPSIVATFSSSIDSKLKSPTSSTSPSTNDYMNSPMSPPPRVPPLPPTQENGSMDITLTLSPITPLDIYFNTPSPSIPLIPSPPLFSHPISWNLLEVHGAPCKELKMHQRGWIELFSDHDCEIRYHPGKANVVAEALSRKERVKPNRIQAMNTTLQSSIKDKILAAQKEASDEPA
ncbi:hypothetical protein Tco_0653862 [Tanacetum coccineum]|uniref:Reverse transcriptase domain-containing protein n=1 Tax=Tanacetum coccineum TaxID=301880 RepID=A0ABQ4X213_9ASTR